jgi:serine/threonine-protein kinase
VTCDYTRALVTPVTFGRYQLLKRLAVGGMAEIYLAKLTGVQGFEKLVVIKRILPNLATEQRFVQMFLDEARLAASLNHPNVVQIFELGEEQGTFFIAMEFIAGQDLAALMRATREPGSELPLEIGARIIADAAQGLHYAHTLKDMRGQPQNLVHRDVTLSNILVTYTGQVKLVDFGIAKAESQQQKTQGGGLKGKYAYMSPEQILGRPLDGRSDVFSLGICLYELLVCRRLFKRDNELTIINDILEGEVPPPSSIRPDVPEALDAIVLKTLEKEREKRYQSAQELQHALEAWLRTQPTQPGTAEVGDFVSLAFAEKEAAYQRLLAQLPTATSEQLAQMLAESEKESGRRSDTKSGTGSGTGSLARLDDANDDDLSISVRVRRKRNPRAIAALALGVVALLGVLGVALGARGGPRATSGSLEVLSTPPGAVVRLNGASTGPKTPATIGELPFGDYRLDVELDGYEPVARELKLNERSPSKQLSLALVKAKLPPGTLAISTTPPGATVVLNGRKLDGVTPLETPAAAGQEHLVRVSLKGYLDDALTVEVGSGEKKSLALELKSEVTAAPPGPTPTEDPTGPAKPGPKRDLASVSLKSTPAADVYQGNTKLGRTPLTVKLPPGKVTLRFSNPAEELNCERVIEVDKAGGERSVTFQKGKLAFSLEPWADVYLGDRKLGTTPIAPREFYEGKLQFRFVNSEEGAIKSATVTVVPGKTTVVREWPR